MLPVARHAGAGSGWQTGWADPSRRRGQCSAPRAGCGDSSLGWASARGADRVWEELRWGVNRRLPSSTQTPRTPQLPAGARPWTVTQPQPRSATWRPWPTEGSEAGSSNRALATGGPSPWSSRFQAQVTDTACTHNPYPTPQTPASDLHPAWEPGLWGKPREEVTRPRS